jgi:hypothetical protein
MYTKHQLKQIIRSGVESEEEEWDLNKKNYLTELKRSNFEKKVFSGCIVLLLLFWQFYYQAILSSQYPLQLEELIKKK